MGYKTINERGADKVRLLNWLVQPKQGIRRELAELGIAAFEQNLQKGIEPHKTSIPFRQRFKKIAEDPKFPESFWIDNYILFWCRKTETKLVKNGSFKVLQELRLEKVSNRKCVILLTILNALIVLNLVTLWIL